MVDIDLNSGILSEREKRIFFPDRKSIPHKVLYEYNIETSEKCLILTCLFSEKEQRLLACDIVEEILKQIKTIPEELTKAISLIRKYARGEGDCDTLFNAYSMAEDIAWQETKKKGKIRDPFYWVVDIAADNFRFQYLLEDIADNSADEEYVWENFLNLFIKKLDEREANEKSRD